MRLKTEHKILWGFVLLGGFLRFYGLGNKPLWVDEAWFGFLVRSTGNQEFVPQLIAWFLPESEFWLRFPSAVAGTLTILAVYRCLNKWKIYGAVFVAVFPLFVFWARMARPYAIAGMFIVLAWRYTIFLIPALLTTPLAIMGLRILNQKKPVLVGAVVLAMGLYLIRQDAGRWTLEQIFISSRWWYIPILVGTLYLCDYMLPGLEHRFGRSQVVQTRG